MASSSAAAATLGDDDQSTKEAEELLLAMENYHPIVRALPSLAPPPLQAPHPHQRRLFPASILPSFDGQRSQPPRSEKIPDAVTEHFLGLSGYQSTDPRVTRVASIAAHKFVADLTNDALRICKQRQQNKGRLVLTTEDLSVSARDYHIFIRKPAYFADAPADPAAAHGGGGGGQPQPPQGWR